MTVTQAQLDNLPPPQTEGVTVDEHLENQLPLDVPFLADTGEVVTLKQYFDGKRPALLVMYYSDCPNLCDTVLTGLMHALRDVTLTAGQDYQVIAISIDPDEKLARARVSKTKYLQLYGRAGTGTGFHFLQGSRGAINQVADAVGFRFNAIRGGEEFAHPAVVTVVTPTGKISRYLYGVEFKDTAKFSLRLSLVEASEGKVGTTIDRILLNCFHYDETEGRYAPAARSIMTLGGGVTAILLMLLLVPAWPWPMQKAAISIGMAIGLVPLTVAVIYSDAAMIAVLASAELIAAGLLLILAIRARNVAEQADSSTAATVVDAAG